MIRHVIGSVLLLAVALTATSCSSSKSESDGKLSVPAASGDLEGQQYQDVVEDLEAAGFTNVSTVSLEDLITGWLNGPDEVDEVEIDGSTDFTADDRFAPDAEIVIFYHSFPTDREQYSTPAPEPSVTAEAETLTTENSAELAALLAIGDNCSSSIADFASKYSGRRIEFDANIGAMANHGGYATRYDMLILAGDYSETSMTGPTFQYRDVNTTNDLHYVGESIPDTIGVGTHLRVTAEVGPFDGDSCQFVLEPVATAFR